MHYYKYTKNILTDQRGVSLTVILLCVIPLLLLGMVAVLDVSKTVQEYDSNLQWGLEEAVRNAAFFVDKQSVSVGEPVLRQDISHQAFLKILTKRIPSGEIEKYTFVVVNYGYQEYDTTKIHTYSYDGESGNTVSNIEDVDPGDSAITLSISESGVSRGNTSEDTTVTFEESGCIGLVKMKTEQLISHEEKSGYRWASSSIVVSKDFY